MRGGLLFFTTAVRDNRPPRWYLALVTGGGKMKKGKQTHNTLNIQCIYVDRKHFLHAIAAATGCVGIVSSSGSNN